MKALWSIPRPPSKASSVNAVNGGEPGSPERSAERSAPRDEGSPVVLLMLARRAPTTLPTLSMLPRRMPLTALTGDAIGGSNAGILRGRVSRKGFRIEEETEKCERTN